MSKEREAFEIFYKSSESQYHKALDNYDTDFDCYLNDYIQCRYFYWQAAKYQAMPASIGDIQSWIAVNSFSALDAVHDNVPIVDANELAKYINSLDLSVSVTEVLKKFCNEHKDPAWRGRLTEYDKGYSDCCIAVLEMIEAHHPSSTSDCPDEP